VPAGSSRSKSLVRGVTLMEMMLVIMLIGLIAAISFPAITSGIDSIRLSTATDSVVAFINRGVNRAERRQYAVEVAILKADNALELHSVDRSLNARLNLPEGVRIEKILPENPALEDEKQRSYLLYPGGTVPRFGLELINRKGARRIVRVDPVTGVPLIEKL
jgi:prepilin-type N-terminal cleavage/methylation domain-containing protein